MTGKAKLARHAGGRGHKAEVKYSSFSVTMHPELLDLLMAHAKARGITRSEMVARMVEHYAKSRPIKGIEAEAVVD